MMGLGKRAPNSISDGGVQIPFIIIQLANVQQQLAKYDVHYKCKQLRKTQHFPRNDDGSWKKGTKFNFGWR